MSLFRKNRLIAVIAQKVIFWIRPQILSVMADGCCFKAMRIFYDCKGPNRGGIFLITQAYRQSDLMSRRSLSMRQALEKCSQHLQDRDRSFPHSGPQTQ